MKFLFPERKVYLLRCKKGEKDIFIAIFETFYEIICYL